MAPHFLISYFESLIQPLRPCMYSSFFVQCSDASSAPGPCACCFSPSTAFLTLSPAPGLRSHLIPPFLRETLSDSFMPWILLPSQTGSGNCKIQAWSRTQKVSWGPDYLLVSWTHFFGDGFKEMFILHGANMAAMAPASWSHLKVTSNLVGGVDILLQEDSN